MTRRFRLLWFCLAFLFALALNEANLRAVRLANPANAELNARSTVYGYTLWSPDNSYYLPPIKNLLAGYGYLIDPANPRTLTRRTPVYPLFYGLHYVLFGEKGSFCAIRYTQLVLHALASILLGQAVLLLTSHAPLARLATVCYALCPFLAIQSYFTLPPALCVFLVALVLYSFARSRNATSLAWLTGTGVLLGALVLTRPVMGLLYPSLLAAIWLMHGGRVGFRETLRAAATMTLGFVLVLSPWTLRNCIVTGGQFVPFEEYADPQGMGSAFESFRVWWFGWGSRPDPPSDYGRAVLGVLSGTHPAEHANLARVSVSQWPGYAFSGTSRNEVEKALVALNECFAERLRLVDPTPTGALRHERSWLQLIPELPCERRVSLEFDALARRFRWTSPIRYYFLTPFAVLRGLVFQSHSLAFGSLDSPDQILHPAQFLCKAVLYLLNVSLFLAWLWVPTSDRLKRPLGSIVLSFPALSLLFFAELFRRGVSAVYLAPLVPLFCVALANAALDVGHRFRRRERAGDHNHATRGSLLRNA